MLSRMSFQIVIAVYYKEYKPYLVVSTIGTSSLKYPLTIFGVTFNLKISSIYMGGLSHADFWKLLWLIDVFVETQGC